MSERGVFYFPKYSSTCAIFTHPSPDMDASTLSDLIDLSGQPSTDDGSLYNSKEEDDILVGVYADGSRYYDYGSSSEDGAYVSGGICTMNEGAAYLLCSTADSGYTWAEVQYINTWSHYTDNQSPTSRNLNHRKPSPFVNPFPTN